MCVCVCVCVHIYIYTHFTGFTGTKVRTTHRRAAEEVRCVCVCVCAHFACFTGAKVRNTDRRAAVEASFAFRDRKVELKSEAELEVLSYLLYWY